MINYIRMTPRYRYVTFGIFIIFALANCTNQLNPEDKLLTEIKNIDTSGNSYSHQDYYESDDTSGNATSHSIGTSYSHALSTGELDWVSVSLTNGGIYIFQTMSSYYDQYSSSALISTTNYYTDTKMTLYNSGLSQLGFNDDKTSTDLFSIITYTATYTGTHYLKVEHYDYFSTGAYYFYYAHQ